jgi:catechol 2,3-dioxygenase-like lactoylglutathione lyase family enzyme
VEHIGINVSDMDRSIAFKTQLLGQPLWGRVKLLNQEPVVLGGRFRTRCAEPSACFMSADLGAGIMQMIHQARLRFCPVFADFGWRV